MSTTTHLPGRWLDTKEPMPPAIGDFRCTDGGHQHRELAFDWKAERACEIADEKGNYVRSSAVPVVCILCGAKGNICRLPTGYEPVHAAQRLTVEPGDPRAKAHYRSTPRDDEA